MAIGRGVQHLEAHRRRAGTDHVELPRRRVGEIDDAVVDERPAVVDAHHHRARVGQIGHPHARPMRQRLVRGGHRVLVVDLAARRRPAVKPRPVPRGDAGLRRARLGGQRRGARLNSPQPPTATPPPRQPPHPHRQSIPAGPRGGQVRCSAPLVAGLQASLPRA